MIAAPVPPASAIQTAASKSFLFMETSHALLLGGLLEPGETSVTAITFRAY
jgi:hypothetical protein